MGLALRTRRTFLPCALMYTSPPSSLVETISPATVADPVKMVALLVRFGECLTKNPSSGDNGAVNGGGGGTTTVDRFESFVALVGVLTVTADDPPVTLLLLRLTRRTFFPSARI